MEKNIATIILAAGLGKRMKSNVAKVLHCVAGKPMFLYPVIVAESISSGKIIVVVGHQSEKVMDAVAGRNVEMAIQAKQNGTADAVRAGMDRLKDFKGTVVILCGDVPLITPETVSRFLAVHEKDSASLTVLTTAVADPSGYGRIVRSSDGSIARIVEDRDADESTKRIREVNTGIYAFDSALLSSVICEIGADNSQKEFYLTDSIEAGLRKGLRVSAYKTDDSQEVMGINSRLELARAEGIMRKRINSRHMLGGVTFIDPESTYIDADVSIGQDVTIYPGTVIQGNTSIADGAIIYSNNRIVNSLIGAAVTIKDSCVIEDSSVGDSSQIGPFAHLRPGCTLDRNVRIGNYVELKKSVMGDGSKANHLTYLGDAEIGSGVNIGAGTITCNYDGQSKNKTVIGNDVFIGSDVQLVAPVKIGDGAFVAAGATVTNDVPPGALAISRVAQENREGWVEERKNKKSRKK